LLTQPTPKAIDTFAALHQPFFAQLAEQVAPDLIGCLLLKKPERHLGSRMLKRLVEKGRSMSEGISPGQQQCPFTFDVRLNQIPEEWLQIAARFRRANGIHDGDRERSMW